MKNLALMIAMLATLLIGTASLQGCGRPDAASHAGTWELDTEVVREAMAAEVAAIEDPEERRAMELGMAMMGEKMLDAMSMTLTLNPDGSAASTTSMMDESETVRGTWSAEGDMLTIVMEQDGQSQAVAARVDGELLELLPPEGQGMPLPMIMRKRPD